MDMIAPIFFIYFLFWNNIKLVETELFLRMNDHGDYHHILYGSTSSCYSFISYSFPSLLKLTPLSVDL